MFRNKHFFGNNMNGLLIINKEKNYTSRDVVNIVSKYINEKKVGHTGTLDPIAEGVLVLTIGKCTKLSNLITHEYKEYIAEFELGFVTDTLDITGKVLKTSQKSVDISDIKKVILSFIGKYKTTVPKYSAIKINGKKLYEYARNNIEVELPTREFEIKDIKILEIKNNKVIIKCLVSKGTYIRSLIRDIGEKLGVYATMTNLKRTKLGNFKIEDSYKLEDIKKGNYKLITVEELYKDYPIINIDDNLYKIIKNGNVLDNIYNSKYILFYYNNKLISLYYEYEKSRIKPLIQF